MFARRPPALGPRCAPGRAGRAGRAGRGAAPGRGRDGAGGARQPARTRPARPHKAGRAEQGRAGSRPPAPGRRARVCAGPGRARDTKGNGRAGAAGGEPRPHRRDPRPPSGLYVSAPGGAASARRPGPPLPPREGGPGTAGRRRAGDRGEKAGRGTCRGEGLSVEVLPLLEPKPGPARPAALPQRMTPGPQLSGAGGRALAGRLQHEEPQQHPPAPRRPMLPGKHSASALDGRRPPAPQTGTQMGAILRNTEAEAARSLPRSRPGAQTSGDLRPFRLLCLPLLHVSTAPGSVRRHAFLLPEALPRLRTDYRLNCTLEVTTINVLLLRQANTINKTSFYKEKQVFDLPQSSG
ncbi:collagen alpha-1(I) chain-like isoform X4 [Meles meles]|uniref:collagen alpha-1(I) chain-like isoform X4 n=1 Tax=Meles meles TaxID=9662 RepID=UPI001E699F6D|nr:collagen alpha-1(I) chain-like isoform X4 [Meles meles]